MRSNRVCGLFLGLLLATCLVRAEEQPVCLLTGFQPFGGAKDNPSWEMLKPLAGQTVSGYRIETVELPVVYDEMAKPLTEAIAKHQPKVVICFGQGGGQIQVERVARNGYHPAKPPDNNGKRPPREKIVPEGAEQLPTQLPVDAILAALEKAKLTAVASDDAGGYLCNECFYRLMAANVLPEAKGMVARGFVHVPRVGARNAAGGVYSLEDLTRAARMVVEMTITAR
jgi:pyroglutamyl-peptidase